MDISRQIVDQRIRKILQENADFFQDDDEERKLSKAFLLLGVAAYLNIDVAEAYPLITDGGNDGGFDAAYIAEGQDMQLNVVLFQSKYTRDLENDRHFPANAVEKAVNTVKCVFDPSANIELNFRSRQKVDEIRSFILDGQIPYVNFVMLNNGLKWNSDGQNHIDNAFKGQEQVHFTHFCHKDIIGYIQKAVPIHAKLNMAGYAVQEDFNYKRVLIGRVSVSQIYELMEEHGDGLLEKNIRRYLGKNMVNDGIAQTLINEEKNQNFFFFNNGITMICNKFGYNGLQEKDWIVKIDGLQIINGGQTCRTIHQIIKENPDKDFSQAFVLVRLYEVSDDEVIVRDITYATNSQNPVDLRDLKSNDEIQKLLESSAGDMGYVYKRKRDNSSSNFSTIYSTVAAEAVFAVWREKPHLAKYRKNEFFDQYYDEIFQELNAAQMIIAVLIFRYCDKERKKNDTFCAHRPYSQHFLACMMGKLLLGHFGIDSKALNHMNFTEIKTYFDQNKQSLYNIAERGMGEMLSDYFNEHNLGVIDGRTMAAAFRRFDLLERYLKNEDWWNSHIAHV